MREGMLPSRALPGAVFCRWVLLPTKRVRTCSVGGVFADETGANLFCRRSCCRRSGIECVPSARVAAGKTNSSVLRRRFLPTRRNRAHSVSGVCCRRNGVRRVLSVGFVADGTSSSELYRQGLLPTKRSRACSVRWVWSPAGWGGACVFFLTTTHIISLFCPKG